MDCDQAPTKLQLFHIHTLAPTELGSLNCRRCLEGFVGIFLVFLPDFWSINSKWLLRIEKIPPSWIPATIWYFASFSSGFYIAMVAKTHIPLYLRCSSAGSVRVFVGGGGLDDVFDGTEVEWLGHQLDIGVDIGWW